MRSTRRTAANRDTSAAGHPGDPGLGLGEVVTRPSRDGLLSRGVWSRPLSLALAVVVLAAVGGAGAPARSDDVPARLTAIGAERRPAPAGAPVAEVTDGVSALADRLGRTQPGGSNWVASPLSIAYAFAMLRAGARGETAAALDEAFGFPTGADEAFNAITERIGTVDVPPRRPPTGEDVTGPAEPVVSIANGVFTQEDLPVGEQFLRTLGEQYGAGVYPVDFAGPEAARAINSWVDRQTAGRIPTLFDGSLSDLQLVLANTVYLYAEWQTRFTSMPAGSVPFTRADGTAVDVPMMSGVAEFRYATGEGWQAVEVPYAGDLVMRVVLPASAADADGLDDLLAPRTMAEVADRLRPERMELVLPSWTFRSEFDLRALAGSLGIAEAFHPFADYSGISPGLSLGPAVHHAYVDVHERGTEAAAATGLGMLVSAPAPPRVVLRVDRPFTFAIVHRDMEVPLFVGQVVDPRGT